jgi:hypothetical protein
VDTQPDAVTPALNDKSNLTAPAAHKKARLNLKSGVPRARLPPTRTFQVKPDGHPLTPSPNHKSFVSSTPQHAQSWSLTAGLKDIPLIEPILEKSCEMDLDEVAAALSSQPAGDGDGQPPEFPINRDRATSLTSIHKCTPPDQRAQFRRPDDMEMLSEGTLADSEMSSPKATPSPSPAKPRYIASPAIDAQAYARKERRRTSEFQRISEHDDESEDSEDSLADRLKYSVGLQDDEAFFAGRTKRRVVSLFPLCS